MRAEDLMRSSSFMARVAAMTPGRPRAILSHPGFILLFFSSLLMLTLRAPDAVLHPQFWAEDGQVFFQQQFGQAWPKLWESYAGYLLFIPRLGAWLSSLLPPRLAPIAFMSFAMLVNAWALAFFFKRSRFFVSPWILLSIYLLTPTNGEVFGTLTNVQWHLQFALLAATFYPIDDSPQATHSPAWRCLLVLVMALTGPLSIFCAAVVVGATAATFSCRLLRREYLACHIVLTWWRSSDKPAIVALLIGASVQAWFVLHAGDVAHTGAFSADLAARYLSRDLQWHVLGRHLIPEFLFVGLTLSMLVFAVYRAMLRSDLRWAIWLGLAAFATAQIFSVSNDTAKALIDTVNLSGDRYFLAIKIAWWTGIAMLLARLPRARNNQVLLPWLVPVTLACLMVFAYPHFKRRQNLPNLHWMRVSKQIDTGPYPLELPINPEGWSIHLDRPARADGHAVQPRPHE